MPSEAIDLSTKLTWAAIGAIVALAAAAVLLLPVLRAALGRVEARARDAERRARQAERLAELGAMTSGLAHEIKNPLSTVGLNAQLLAEEIEDAELPMPQRERLIRRVGALGREAERLRDILNDFLRYAGRMQLDPQPHDLATIIEELGDFLHPQCARWGILLRTDVAARPVVIDVDAGLLKQALLNLMLNAMQAMSGGGTPPPEHAPHRELIVRLEHDDREARIHVIDTGPGIPPERLESIFHPYMTTKAGGTGLGLPTARRIVEEHGGRLVAHSTPGRGSDFVIHLPAERSGTPAGADRTTAAPTPATTAPVAAPGAGVSAATSGSSPGGSAQDDGTTSR